ncbi:MAG: hypothetical protein HYY02_01730 [Chloroflexi bacterium]|nr:hypothetical protein [Chloroflexota bacterium]
MSAMRRLTINNWPVVAQVLLGPVLMLLGLAAMLFTSSVMSDRLRATTDSVGHTYQVISEAGELFRLVVDMQTGR